MLVNCNRSLVTLAQAARINGIRCLLIIISKAKRVTGAVVAAGFAFQYHGLRPARRTAESRCRKASRRAASVRMTVHFNCRRRASAFSTLKMLLVARIASTLRIPEWRASAHHNSPATASLRHWRQDDAD